MTHRRAWSLLLLAVCSAACSSDGAKHKAAGNVLFKQGDLDGAIAEYRAALSAAPGDANAHTLYANALFERGSLDEARREYQAALSVDPRARAALQGLSTVALREQKPAESRALLERMLANEPRDVEAHAALGKLLYAEGDLDGAERHLREALVYAQNDRSALYTLGLVLAKKRDQEQANAIFDRLDSLTPGKAYSPYGRAVAAATVGHDDEALKWLAVALDRGIDDLGQVEADQSFGALRASPRFAALVAAARTRAPPRKGSP
jgi:tetratricopeptide (TPR) repeat protein